MSLRSSRALSGWIESIFILSLKQPDVWVRARSLTPDTIIIALKTPVFVAPLEAELLEQVSVKDKSILASFRFSFTIV